jgi:hypothetical protein
VKPMVRKISAIALAAVIACTTGVMVAEAGGGNSKAKSAANFMYLSKPGCGPDKTNGVAGASGRHTGQPPKAENRQDCPSPPGQQK